MKDAHIRTIVRLPVASLVKELVEAHSIRLPLESVRLEGDVLVVTFGAASADRDLPSTSRSGTVSASDLTLPPVSDSREDQVALRVNSPRTRGRSRRSGKRNRMKTGGWKVVAKMENSKGLTVAVYEPLVAALKDSKEPRRKKERIVRELLQSNGNDPGPESVRYFLENTLEYLSREVSK